MQKISSESVCLKNNNVIYLYHKFNLHETSYLYSIYINHISITKLSYNCKIILIPDCHFLFIFKE